MVLGHAGDAGGAPLDDVVTASMVGAVALAAVVLAGWAHRSGRWSGLERAAAAATRVPRFRGLPPWAALPAGVATVSLLLAVFGFYWDVSTHIDNGRDEGPFANPSHWFILVGLAGIALAGALSVIVGTDDRHPGAVRIRGSWRAPVGGVLLLACGVIALLGFPLDDVWHRLFGQDVTLWGPTHIQMVAGASLATLAIWVLVTEARRVDPHLVQPRAARYAVGAAFLIGLATLQGEFDFGVPQFRLVFQPILLALAAGIGLVTARVALGRGGAVAAAAGFVALRAVLALLIGPVLGRSVPHFPLFAVEALVVEAVFFGRTTAPSWRRGALAGLGVGTVGFAAEWVWSHLWMPIPWRGDLLPEAALWAAAVGTAAGVLGAAVGSVLADDVPERTAVAAPATPATRAPRLALAGAGVVAVAALAWALPTDGADVRASVRLTEVATAAGRAVEATVTLDPPDAGDDAAFLTALAWQGRAWHDGTLVQHELQEVRPGVWRTTGPLPVHGEWKALVRLHRGRTLAALPVRLPEDPGIPAAEVPAPASFERPFVPDREVLQREFTGGPAWLERTAYSVLGAIAVGWIALVVWALGRLSAVSVRGQATPPAGRGSLARGARRPVATSA